MIVTSAFSGIGGIDLGLSAAIPEAEIRYQVEIDPYCRKVLEKHWPKATRYNDIQTVKPADIEGTTCIIAGVPCQDTSVASPTGSGLEGERSGLWREIKRLIRTVPTVQSLIVENVPGLLGRGMGTILGDIHESGFSYAEWDCLSSAAIGACHRRDRIWIIATRDTPHSYSGEGWERFARGEEEERETIIGSSKGTYSVNATNTVSPGLSERERMEGSWALTAITRNTGWDTEPPVPTLDDGLPRRLVNRRDKIKALGNSVQPQVAYYVGLRLKYLMKEASDV